MKHKTTTFGVIGFFSLLALSLPASAQQIQPGRPLQNQTSNTQNTGTLESTSSPNQGGNADVLNTKTDSLGVVSNPSQTNPSVSVGQTETKTDISNPTADSDGSVMPIIWTIVILVGFFFFIYLFTNRSKKIEDNENVKEKTVSLEKIDPKIQSKMASKKKTAPKPKNSNSQNAKKKSSKKTKKRR